MAVRVDLSESLHLMVAPNKYLNALGAGKFGTATLASYQNFINAKPNAATATGLSVEHATEILKAALPVELGRTGGVYPVPSNKNKQETVLRAVIAKDSDKKKKKAGSEASAPAAVKKLSPLTKFNTLFKDYIVPIYRVPHDLILARKNNPMEIPESFRGKGREPSYDAGKVQIFLIKLAKGEEEARTTWLANTILPEKAAKRYLSYLDARVAEINSKFGRTDKEAEAVDKAQSTLKSLEVKIGKLKKVFEALSRDDASRPAKKAELKVLVEKHTEASGLLEEAEEALKERKAELAKADAKLSKKSEDDVRKILVHQLFVGDWAVVIERDQNGKTDEGSGAKGKKKAKKDGDDDEDDEEEEDDDNNDDDEGEEDDASITTPVKASTERIPEDGITLDMVELIPLNNIIRIQAAAHDIYRSKNDDKGISDSELKDLFEYYGSLRNSAMYTKKSFQKSIKHSVFPDQYTLEYEPLLRRVEHPKTRNIFNVPHCDAHFPVFSVRTLIANYVSLMQLRATAMATKKPDQSASKRATTDKASASKSTPKKGQVLIDISESDADKKKADSSSSSSPSSSSSSSSDSSDDEEDEKDKKKKKTAEEKPAVDKKKAADEKAISAKKKADDEKAASVKKEAAKKKKADDEAAAEAAKKKAEEDAAAAAVIAAAAAALKKKEAAAAKKKAMEEEAASAVKKKREEEEKAAAAAKKPNKKAAKEAPPKQGALDLSLSQDASSDSDLPNASSKKGTKRKVDDDEDIKSVSEERAHKSKKSKKATEEPSAAPTSSKKIAKKPALIDIAAMETEEAKKPQPASKKRTAAAAIDLSSDDGEASNPKSAEKVKKPPAKKARDEEAVAKAAETDVIQFDDEDIGDIIIKNLIRYGSWNLADIIEPRDTDAFKSVQEEANALVASVQTANFHDHELVFTSMPLRSELETAHRTFALSDEPRSTAVLFKAAITAHNVDKLPLITADGIISKSAVIEADYEHAAHDYITSAAGHMDVASQFSVAVGSIDLVLRSCHAEKYGIPTLVEINA